MQRPINALLVLLFISVLLLLALAGSQVGEATNPASVLLASTPTPTLRRGTPPKATPSPRAKQTPIRQPQQGKVFTKGTAAPSQTIGGWQLMYSDGFEIYDWPYPPWTVVDRSNDGYDRKWGDSSWFAHLSTWALWPAADGLDSIYPPTQYADNMDTRMTYGPFDLSDAGLAELHFWLWRDMESCCDYLALEISFDGQNFQELGRWTSFADWELEVIYLDSFVGNSQVWLAWRFYSDYSNRYQGPWVDDIEIWKYVPGEVTIQGTLKYSDRGGQEAFGRFTTVSLHVLHANGRDEERATTITNNYGDFVFPNTRNWDDEDSSPDPTARRLDVYFVLGDYPIKPSMGVDPCLI